LRFIVDLSRAEPWSSTGGGGGKFYAASAGGAAELFFVTEDEERCVSRHRRSCWMVAAFSLSFSSFDSLLFLYQSRHPCFPRRGSDAPRRRGADFASPLGASGNSTSCSISHETASSRRGRPGLSSGGRFETGVLHNGRVRGREFGRLGQGQGFFLFAFRSKRVFHRHRFSGTCRFFLQITLSAFPYRENSFGFASNQHMGSRQRAGSAPKTRLPL